MNQTSLKILKATGLALLMLIFSPLSHAQSAPSQSDIESYEGLHQAAHKNDVEQILSLLKAGADIEARDSSGRTPLIVAAFASNEESVRALEKAGADLNALEHQAYDIVTIASVANDIEMLDLALELGANSGNITSPYDGTALIAAAHLGHHAVVDSLIKAKAPLDHVNNLGWTALIEAVILGDGKSDHIETVRLLLEAEADRTIADRQGMTPLEHAKSRNYDDMLLVFEANP